MHAQLLHIRPPQAQLCLAPLPLPASCLCSHGKLPVLGLYHALAWRQLCGTHGPAVSPNLQELLHAAMKTLESHY